jgi:hypothetical protein
MFMRAKRNLHRHFGLIARYRRFPRDGWTAALDTIAAQSVAIDAANAELKQHANKFKVWTPWAGWGAVSHFDYRTKGPKEHHPSAFSRHGAGPNYVIKPLPVR